MEGPKFWETPQKPKQEEKLVEPAKVNMDERFMGMPLNDDLDHDENPEDQEETEDGESW